MKNDDKQTILVLFPVSKSKTDPNEHLQNEEDMLVEMLTSRREPKVKLPNQSHNDNNQHTKKHRGFYHIILL